MNTNVPESTKPAVPTRGKGRPSQRGPDFQYPNRLRAMRMRSGFTLKYVADLLKVRPQAIHNAEVSGEGLSRQNWYKLADLFDCDPRILETPEPPDLSP
jgi:Helix-turn-helix